MRCDAGLASPAGGAPLTPACRELVGSAVGRLLQALGGVTGSGVVGQVDKVPTRATPPPLPPPPPWGPVLSSDGAANGITVTQGYISSERLRAGSCWCQAGAA